jgi:mannose-6-phosphate isomerase
MTVRPLTGVIRPYAWGSRSVLAALQGRPVPSDGPEAELWLGAHPGDPSTVPGPDGPTSLATVIADDPDGQLGAQVAGEFGARLPYLLKILAAESPLSLQAHPDADYAREAFARQEADPDVPRNYTDAFHKPEMLVALTPFEALCGFRDPGYSADVLAELAVPSLEKVIAALRRGPDGLGEAVRLLLSWPAEDRPALVKAVGEAAARKPDPRYAESLTLATNLASRYPNDPGVLVALLLNHVHLAPGEAIWMPAGNLHAYLHGAGVEIMAASDNVLRGGFTAKRVDVDELLRVLRFEVLDDPILPATELAPGVLTWPVPAREFALYRIRLDGTRPPTVVPAEGPRLIVGIEGDVFVAQDHGTPTEVGAGTAAFATADAGPITVAGVGEIFVAAVPA